MVRFVRLGWLSGALPLWLPLWLLLLPLWLLATAGPAAAHAALDRSDPSSGAVLPEPPAEARLHFTEPLEPRFTRADLLDAAGQPVAGAASQVAPDNDHVLILTLPADLPDGGYTVAWRNLSAADGHTLQGYFGFAVGAGGAPGALAPEQATTPDAPREVSRGLALIGLALLLAIAPLTLGVLAPAVRASPDLADGLTQRLRRFAVGAVALALVGSLLALLAQAAAVAPDLALPQATWDTLTGTRYGEIWLRRLFGLLVVSGAVVVGVWGPERASHAALRLAAFAGVFVPLTFSLVSHAAAQPEGATAAIVADALHLLAAAIWGGGVVLLAAVVLQALRPVANGVWRDALRVVIPRFSVLGLAAWGILWLSGVYAAWLQVGSLPALVETPYGRTLLLKGALLLPILALAAWHFWQGRDLARARLPRLAATLALEALLVITVLLVVGRLIGQPPAREVMASRTPVQLQVPLTFPAPAGERAATLSISPGAAGNNTFTLDVAGEPLPERTEGVLRVNLTAQDLGEQELRLPQVAPNRFAADGTELAVAGDWQLTAILREIGAFSWTTQAALRLTTTPPAPPVVNPPPRFDGLGIAGMLLLAIGCVALAVWSGRQRRPGRSLAGPAGALCAVAGLALLLVGRIPVATAPGPELTATLLASTPLSSSVPATPDSAHTHEHMAMSEATPVSAALPGVGTPVTTGDFSVTLEADTRYAAPADLVLTVTDATGSPVAGARVVVFVEMAGMGGGHRESLTAEEQAPGRYVAAYAPLTMPGPWEIVARVSPKGQPSSTVRFGVEVGGG